MTYVDETDFYLFLQGYREAMLWANTLEYGGDGAAHDELGSALYASDAEIAPEAWAEAESECRDFLEAVVSDEVLPLSDDGSILWPGFEPYGAEAAGHDFALTRNGHGAGFWDRGLGEVGETLSKMAKAYGDATWILEGDEVTSL